jgi:hypothetical protein
MCTVRVYENEERPRGFLGKKDRDFLNNPTSYGNDKKTPRQARYQRRKAIKERIAHAFVDMAMLADVTNEELLDELLGGAADELYKLEEVDRRTPFMMSAMSLIYDFVERARADKNHLSDDVDNRFERAVAAGMTRSESRRSDDELVLSAASVDIEDPKVITPDNVRQKVDEGRIHELDEEELLFVVYTDQDEFRERMNTLVEEYDVPKQEAYRSVFSFFQREGEDTADEETEPDTDDDE